MLEDKLRAPEEMFAVCVWDPSNPEKSIPRIAKTTVRRGRKETLYKSERYAIWYAKMRNDRWYRYLRRVKAEGKSVIGENEYFVIDDKGVRIF